MEATSRSNKWIGNVVWDLGFGLLLLGTIWVWWAMICDVFLEGAYYSGWRMLAALGLVAVGLILIYFSPRFGKLDLGKSEVISDVFGSVAIISFVLSVFALIIVAVVRIALAILPLLNLPYHPLSFNPWQVPVALSLVCITTLILSGELAPEYPTPTYEYY